MAEERVDRRLAAILCADVAGYSRLMGLDEEATLAALKSHRRELIDPLISQHQGRIVKTTGDGILIEFGSVVDAVRFAVVVQQGMHDRNGNLPESQCIRFRIGINVGDVIVDDGDIFGDGVNVAARLQTLAAPGEVCVSATVREQVGRRLPINFADMGEHIVKNIAQPIHVYRIEKERVPDAAPVLALPERPSIAVLPFQNMSGDTEQDYFVDGMVEDIITGLSRIKWLFVVARNSSFIYKGKAVDVKQVGRELGVRYVLEGSVRKSGTRIRINAQLIEASTGSHLWAERYDRNLDDIFAVQDEITLAVVGAIEPSLRAAEIEYVKRKRPESLDAYDLVLRALPEVYTCMPAGAAKGLTYLERAFVFEPNYALAHGVAAWAHEILYVRSGLQDVNRRGAIDHAHAAIGHGRSDPMALTFGAFSVAMVEHDRTAAFEAFEQAIKICPSHAPAYMLGSAPLSFAGEAQRAIEWGERAMRLSPFDPMGYIAYQGITIGYAQLGRYEEAAAAARKAVQTNPLFSFSYAALAMVLVKLGRIDEAKTAAARVIELQPNFSISRQCAAVGILPVVAEPLTQALRVAGLSA